MEYQEFFLNRQHWSAEEIPYASIARDQVNRNRQLFYLLASASFVEITSDLYTHYLADFFHADADVRDWLEEFWLHEEVQHGVALKQYINTVWPKFDWDQAYRDFYCEYSRRCNAKQLEPTPALEMVSRCVVETGTATLYTMLHRMISEPVLRRLTAHIKNDEVRHYRHFYHYFLRYQERERMRRYVLLEVLLSRISKIDKEDGYYAFKHVFAECHPQLAFQDSDYEAFCRHYRRLARRYYPYEMAAKMLLKPLRLTHGIQRVAVPLLLAGAKSLCT